MKGCQRQPRESVKISWGAEELTCLPAPQVLAPAVPWPCPARCVCVTAKTIKPIKNLRRLESLMADASPSAGEENGYTTDWTPQNKMDRQRTEVLILS